MFDNLEPSQGVPPGPANPNQPSAPAPFPPQAKADDIFAGVKEVGLPKTKDGSSMPPPLKVANRAQGSSGGVLKILIILIVVLILAILGLVVASRYFGFGGLSQFLPQKEEIVIPVVNETAIPVEETEEKAEPVKEDDTSNSGMPGVVEEETTTSAPVSEMPGMPSQPVIEQPVATSSEVDKNIEAMPALDSDSDGVSDKDELSLGTDPNKADTDGDALTDGEEVNTYKTSPLKVDTDNDELSDFDEVKIYLTNPTNPDTDADTFLDGKEVKGGYNPKGPGKLVK